jgi:hypothetical protein
MASPNSISNVLSTSEWVFPVFECFHIAAFAFSIGMIALVDLRLLGLGMRRQTPAQLVRETDLWTLLGLAVVLFSGPILFLSDTSMYLHNGSFRFKMICLLLAIVFNYTIHRKVSLGEFPPLVCGVTGAISLVLWLSVVAGGLFIAFVPIESY